MASSSLTAITKAAACLLLAPASLTAETICILPGADTGLFELDPDYNLGGQRDLPSGALGSFGDEKRCRILYRFDIALAIPNGSIIQSAKLHTTVTRRPFGAANSVFSLLRVLKEWGEGDKRGDNPGGAPAEPNESTWNSRFHGSSLWTEPGGKIGEDYAAAPRASSPVLDVGNYTFTFNGAGISDIQEMLDDPQSNFGWCFLSESEGTPKSARRFSSREHRTDPPRLVIEYIPASNIVEIVLDPENVAIRFVGLANLVYHLEISTDLKLWQLVQIIPASKSNGERQIFQAAGGMNRVFFRIIHPRVPP